MALIKNLIKDREEHKVKEEGDEEDDKPKKLRPTIKTPTDLQRLKLEKLMKNPDKLVEIPEHKHDNDFMKTVPSFVRNVMGSSAGAGSGEFHVYRHLRRKEFARQKLIGSISQREKLDDEYQKKLEENHRNAEQRTAKKRAKRQKKKCKKARRQHDGTKQQHGTQAVDEESASSEDEERSSAEENDSSKETKGKAKEEQSEESVGCEENDASKESKEKATEEQSEESVGSENKNKSIVVNENTEKEDRDNVAMKETESLKNSHEAKEITEGNIQSDE